MSQGHDKSADLWAFGVLIYELLTGKSAFYKTETKQVDMMKRIVRVELEIPPSLDDISVDLIRKLIVRNPAKRLGNLSNGSRDISDHPWFKSIDWKNLTRKKMKAPWIPTIKDGTVTDSHYDASGDAYRDIVFGRTLTKEEQIIFRGF